MAGTVNSDQRQSVVEGLVIARDLSEFEMWLPLAADRPPQIVHPSLRADGRHRTIHVTGEMHHPDLILQGHISPLRGYGILPIREGGIFGRAHAPNDRVLDIELLLHVDVVQMLGRWQSPNAARDPVRLVPVFQPFPSKFRDPGRVLIGREELPILMLDAVHDRLAVPLLSVFFRREIRGVKRGIVTVARSIEVVNVDAIEGLQGGFQ